MLLRAGRMFKRTVRPHARSIDREDLVEAGAQIGHQLADVRHRCGITADADLADAVVAEQCDVDLWVAKIRSS